MTVKKRAAILFVTAEAVEDAFYDALASGDLEKVMALWAPDEDTLCVHPGGRRLIGLAEIRASYDEILRDGPLNIRPTGRRTFQSGALAVHHVIERVRVAGPQASQDVHLSCTNVYTKGPLGWQILMHHASPGGVVEAVPHHDHPPQILH